jgi:hypothetical protein
MNFGSAHLTSARIARTKRTDAVSVHSSASRSASDGVGMVERLLHQLQTASVPQQFGCDATTASSTVCFIL